MSVKQMKFGRCLVFHGIDEAKKIPKLSIEEFPLPDNPSQLSDGQVLLSLSLATVCGSDLHTLRGRRVEPTPRFISTTQKSNSCCFKHNYYYNIRRIIDKYDADPLCFS